MAVSCTRNSVAIDHEIQIIYIFIVFEHSCVPEEGEYTLSKTFQQNKPKDKPKFLNSEPRYVHLDEKKLFVCLGHSS